MLRAPDFLKIIISKYASLEGDLILIFKGFHSTNIIGKIVQKNAVRVALLTRHAKMQETLRELCPKRL